MPMISSAVNIAVYLSNTIKRLYVLLARLLRTNMCKNQKGCEEDSASKKKHLCLHAARKSYIDSKGRSSKLL